MKVGVKFCGNCNPQINMGDVLQELAQSMGATFVRWDDKGYDILLILSGCSSDCASRPDFAGPTVAATYASVDLRPTPEAELAARIAETLNKIFIRRFDPPDQTEQRHDGTQPSGPSRP